MAKHIDPLLLLALIVLVQMLNVLIVALSVPLFFKVARVWINDVSLESAMA